jgi:Glycine zipper
LAGTAAGAGTGAVIGKALGNTGAGALVGGAVGLVTGTAIGNSIDEAKEKKAVQQAAAVQAEAQKRWPTLMEIQQMSASGTNDGIIINQIRSTGAVYNLRADDIQWLQQNGVHDGVIVEMQATATRAQPPVVYQPVPVRERVVVVEEPPPPPAVRFGYYRRW